MPKYKWNCTQQPTKLNYEKTEYWWIAQDRSWSRKKTKKKVRFNPNTEINADEIEKIEESTDESDQILVNTETQKLVEKYKSKIFVKYREELSKNLVNRNIPNKIKYCKDSLKKIKAANIALKALVEIHKDELEKCLNINTLIYATAITIVGTKTKPPTKLPTHKKVNTDLDVDKMDGAVDEQPVQKKKICENRIVSLRKKIGKLTDLNNNPSTCKEKKLKHLLKGGDVKTTIENMKMKLAAESKRIRNAKFKKTRFKNNKLFFAKQKQFYSQMKGE